MSLIQEAAAVLIAAGFTQVEYEHLHGEVATPGFILEETVEPGVLYLARDRLTSGALTRGDSAKAREYLARYVTALEAAGWLTEMKTQHLLVARGDLGS